MPFGIRAVFTLQSFRYSFACHLGAVQKPRGENYLAFFLPNHIDFYPLKCSTASRLKLERLNTPKNK